MTHNDALRSLRYLLNVGEATLVDIFRLGNREVSRADVAAYLKTEDEAGYQPCSDVTMAHFLNGMVTYKRGKQEGDHPNPSRFPSPTTPFSRRSEWLSSSRTTPSSRSCRGPAFASRRPSSAPSSVARTIATIATAGISS